MAPFRFADREDAGQLLARTLEGIVFPPAVVLGVPRGGVAVALPIALHLHAPLGVAYARKVALPIAPELAVGALDEDGRMLVDHVTLRELGAAPEALAIARREAWAELERQRALYRAPDFIADLSRCAVVVVDDGLATGLTVRATLAYLRRHGARQVVVAAPCASDHAVTRIAREADRLVCPVVDAGFQAVGTYYDAFDAVPDERVRECLKRASVPVPQPGPPPRRRARPVG